MMYIIVQNLEYESCNFTRKIETEILIGSTQGQVVQIPRILMITNKIYFLIEIVTIFREALLCHVYHRSARP